MSPLVASVTYILSLLTVLGGVITLVIALGLLLKQKEIIGFFGSQALLFSFLIALGGVAASLFYSEIAGFAPCLLCWIQRFLLYPQAVIFLVGLVKKNARALRHGVYLSFIALPVALYSTYLQFGGSPLVACPPTGPSCAVRYFLEFGYVTIPTMSLTAFVLLIALYFAKRALDKQVN